MAIRSEDQVLWWSVTAIDRNSCGVRVSSCPGDHFTTGVHCLSDSSPDHLNLYIRRGWVGNFSGRVGTKSSVEVRLLLVGVIETNWEPARLVHVRLFRPKLSAMAHHIQFLFLLFVCCALFIQFDATDLETTCSKVWRSTLQCFCGTVLNSWIIWHYLPKSIMGTIKFKQSPRGHDSPSGVCFRN